MLCYQPEVAEEPAQDITAPEVQYNGIYGNDAIDDPLDHEPKQSPVIPRKSPRKRHLKVSQSVFFFNFMLSYLFIEIV